MLTCVFHTSAKDGNLGKLFYQLWARLTHMCRWVLGVFNNFISKGKTMIWCHSRHHCHIVQDKKSSGGDEGGIRILNLTLDV